MRWARTFYCVFYLSPKLRVVHIRKNLKFSLSQKWLQRFLSNFVSLLHIRTSTIWHYRHFPEKIVVSRIIYFFNFLSAPGVAPKPTHESCSNSIFRALLQLSPASPFHFRPMLNIKSTLMLRVVDIRNELTDRHGILQTWSFVSVAMLLNQQERPPRKYCYQSCEIYCL